MVGKSMVFKNRKMSEVYSLFIPLIVTVEYLVIRYHTKIWSPNRRSNYFVKRVFCHY